MELKDTIDGMLSDCYKERFIAEYQQAKIRWQKLNTMLIKYMDGELDFTPKSNILTLVNQATIMQSYIITLEIRAEQEGIKLT